MTKYKQKANLKIIYREAEIVKEEAVVKQIETSSFSSMLLAVCGTVEVRLRANNTVGDEVGVGPVISLGTLTIDKSSRVRDSSPETATTDVFAPGIALSVKDQLAFRDSKAVVVHGLPRRIY
jgi:hypothetical protein